MSEPTVFGRGLGEAVARSGSLGQFAGIEHAVLDQGHGRGSRVIRVWTGGGLEVEILPDRGFDLGAVRVDGIPVAWIGPRGAVGAAHDPDREFVGGFSGGLLFTCGLDTFGPPSVDAGVALPQHGRISRQPATLTRAEVADDRLLLEATVVQTALFQEHLVLRRRIELPLGGTEILLHDTVENAGDADQPHMVLYHANLGWPLLEEGAELRRSAGTTAGVRPPATDDLELWDRIEAPEPGAVERVYLHRMAPSPGGSSASLTNRRVGLRATIGFDLPFLFEWRMLGRGAYVLGLEPANSPVMDGRAAARAAGELPVLAPGAAQEHRIRFAFERV